MNLIVYVGVIAALFVVAGIAFWWRRYHTGHDWRCSMCGQPGQWRYQEYTLCSDNRCLAQAQAEHQWRRENP